MKNSLACVIFKEKKNQFFQLFLRLEKWELSKDISPGCSRVESKLVLISKYNKTIDKVFREKKITSDCPILYVQIF